MKYSIVLSAQSTRFAAVTFEGDLQRNLANISELGYDGVELAIRDPSELDCSALQEMLLQHGLSVPAIGTGQAWGEEHLSFTDPRQETREQATRRVLAHIPFAAQVGAKLVIGLVRGVIQPGVAEEQATEWMLEALAKCAHQAAASNVRLCLEPMNRYETDLVKSASEGLEVVDLVGADNLGLLLDTFHMNIEEQSIVGAIRAAGKHLFHCHVADSNRWHPGAGHINFGEILQALRTMDYRGYVSGEFLPLPDAGTAAERAILHLRSVAPDTR